MSTYNIYTCVLPLLVQNLVSLEVSLITTDVPFNIQIMRKNGIGSRSSPS